MTIYKYSVPNAQDPLYGRPEFREFTGTAAEFAKHVANLPEFKLVSATVITMR